MQEACSRRLTPLPSSGGPRPQSCRIFRARETKPMPFCAEILPGCFRLPGIQGSCAAWRQFHLCRQRHHQKRVARRWSAGPRHAPIRDSRLRRPGPRATALPPTTPIRRRPWAERGVRARRPPATCPAISRPPPPGGASSLSRRVS